ncbi:hypothetical protein [Paenibacillus sp. 1781tsa1]|uniref:hypothetical protein n=1 Tax=Paenibacillus sp. 1781tsa1 TaxID=2953810 RepID=UPI00209D7B53|nr:hypothetical protein [Paenibacillus sp. 1781tsa1]MCP1181960.1 hypothetical protein [Paenibacillus sp. 1781tsa1]
MSEKWKIELHMSPGGWTAEVNTAADAAGQEAHASAEAGKTGTAVAGVFTVTGTPARLSEAEREAVLAQLRKRPLTLYALLRGGPAPEELAGLLPAAQAPEGSPGAATASAAVACTCGRPNCAHAAAAEHAVAARLAAEPLLQLAHAGLPREALLAGVLGAWAEELAHDPSGPGRAAERLAARKCGAAKAARPLASGSPRPPRTAPCISRGQALAPLRCASRSRASRRPCRS